MKQAIGIVETEGLVAAIEAADAMLKASEVKLINVQHKLKTILIEGDEASVVYAINAGSVAASRVGKVISTHVISEPKDKILEILIGKSSSKVKNQIEEKIVLKSVEQEKGAELLTEEDIEQPAKENEVNNNSVTIEQLEVMNVHDLRHFARTYPNYPIKGREISKANRDVLLQHFKNLL